MIPSTCNLSQAPFDHATTNGDGHRNGHGDDHGDLHGKGTADGTGDGQGAGTLPAWTPDSLTRSRFALSGWDAFKVSLLAWLDSTVEKQCGLQSSRYLAGFGTIAHSGLQRILSCDPLSQCAHCLPSPTLHI